MSSLSTHAQCPQSLGVFALAGEFILFSDVMSACLSKKTIYTLLIKEDNSMTIVVCSLHTWGGVCRAIPIRMISGN